MKKSRLLEIIQEEIQNILNEVEDPIQTAFTKALTRDGDIKLGGTGMGNIMHPELIHIVFDTNQIYYKTLVDGKKMEKKETEDLIKYFTKMDIKLDVMDNENLENISKILKSKNIDFTWDDAFDPS